MPEVFPASFETIELFRNIISVSDRVELRMYSKAAKDDKSFVPTDRTWKLSCVLADPEVSTWIQMNVEVRHVITTKVSYVFGRFEHQCPSIIDIHVGVFLVDHPTGWQTVL